MKDDEKKPEPTPKQDPAKPAPPKTPKAEDPVPAGLSGSTYVELPEKVKQEERPKASPAKTGEEAKNEARQERRETRLKEKGY